MHLQTEHRHWEAYVRPLAEKNGLLWDIKTNYGNETILAVLVHPAHSDKGLSVDVDRAYNSEKAIKHKIHLAINKLVSLQ